MAVVSKTRQLIQLPLNISESYVGIVYLPTYGAYPVGYTILHSDPQRNYTTRDLLVCGSPAILWHHITGPYRARATCVGSPPSEPQIGE